MASGSYMTPIYSRSQSEVQGDLHKWKHAMKNFMGSKVLLAEGCANFFGENNQKEGFKRNERKEKGNK
ncbi:hypothetical protein TNCV_2693381 [Trichonephila clavipes]|nr:hypothetical protein TNCV_2693381 [Trichonephila clavipes]